MQSNKKGQTTLAIILIVLLIVVAFGAGIIVMAPQPKVIDDSTTPRVSMVNAQSCMNQGDQLGFTAECTLTIKNLENYPVQIQPVFKCWKIVNPSDISYIEKSEYALVANGEAKYTLEYDNDGRDWSCTIHTYNIRTR